MENGKVWLVVGADNRPINRLAYTSQGVALEAALAQLIEAHGDREFGIVVDGSNGVTIYRSGGDTAAPMGWILPVSITSDAAGPF